METVPYATSPAPRRPHRWVAWTICALLVAASGTAVGLIAMLPNAVVVPPPVRETLVNVKVQDIVAFPSLTDTLEIAASVEPYAVVSVAAEVSGRVERYATRAGAVQWRGRILEQGTRIDEGEPIREGDPILYLNTDLLLARYQRARAQFDYDEREYRRLLDLWERGTTSRTELDDARTRMEISKAAMDETQRELERATIVAPLSGILNRLPLKIGEYATPGVTMAEIVDMDRVKIVVDVPERDIHFVAVGDAIEVVGRAPEAFVLEGRITYLSELADLQARTTRTEITVPNPDHRLRAGQIVRVRLTRRTIENAILIPLEAVIPLEVGKVVYVVDEEGRAQRRDVELGLIKGREVCVLSGLSAGDQLIVAGHRYVGPGQPVAITDWYVPASDPAAAEPGTPAPGGS